jgi:hypothetical protein
VPVGEQAETGADRRGAAALVNDRQAQRLAPKPCFFANPADEPPIRMEAAERDVLAVVRRRIGIALSLGQRLHRAAERGPGLVHRHLVTRVDEVERGGESGEPATHHRNLHLRSPVPTILIFVSVDSRGGPSKTSNPPASTRSSVAR